MGVRGWERTQKHMRAERGRRTDKLCPARMGTQLGQDAQKARGGVHTRSGGHAQVGTHGHAQVCPAEL